MDSYLFVRKHYNEVIELFRYITLYTLINPEDAEKAKRILEAPGKHLPGGASLRVYLRGVVNPNETALISTYGYGDVAQIIDFPSAEQARDFQNSVTFREQQEASKGVFSNYTTTTTVH